MPLNLEKLTNATVKSAIEALEKGDTKVWLPLFTPDAQLYDDGREIEFSDFTKNALGYEHFTSIDQVENNGLDVYGHFHSDQWEDFKTYFKAIVNTEGKITRLEIGQADY
jgi:hypothetical protein